MSIPARPLLWATAATLGLSGATAAAVSGVAAWLVYHYTRARGVWGTDEPPAGTAEEVEFRSAEDGTRICGWLLRSPAGGPAPAVVLCHGVWTGRRECLPLALRFREAGYHVLCFDFRAHGLSDGRYITIGHHETNDVLGAVHFLRDRPEVDARRIGVVGFSMGAAATIQAAARCPEIAAVVADSAYASFVEAVQYSFRHAARLPRYPFAPIALRWAGWLVRVDPRQLRPVDAVARISPRPLFLTHGEEDEIVPARHARLLFAAAGEPKQLWVVPGARHVGARDLQPELYFTRVEGFLRQALGAGASVLKGAGA